MAAAFSAWAQTAPPPSLGEIARQLDDVRAENKALREDVDALKARLSAAPEPAPKTFSKGVTLRTGGYTVAPNEVVEGDVRTISGTLKVLGEVRGDVSTVSGDIEVDGTVTGNVATVSGAVVLGPRAVVKGDVQRVSGSLSQATGARVEGSVRGGAGGWRMVSTVSNRSDLEIAMFRSAMPIWAVGILCVAGFFLLVAAPRRVDTVGRAFVNRPGQSFLVGLMGLPLLLLLAVVSVITVVGPVVVTAVTLGAAILGVCAMALMLGRRMVLGQSYRSRFYPFLIGLLVWWAANTVSTCLPVVNVLAIFGSIIAYTAAFGAVLITGFGRSPVWIRERVASDYPPLYAE